MDIPYRAKFRNIFDQLTLIKAALVCFQLTYYIEELLGFHQELMLHQLQLEIDIIGWENNSHPI